MPPNNFLQAIFLRAARRIAAKCSPARTRSPAAASFAFSSFCHATIRPGREDAGAAGDEDRQLVLAQRLREELLESRLLADRIEGDDILHPGGGAPVAS